MKSVFAALIYSAVFLAVLLVPAAAMPANSLSFQTNFRAITMPILNISTGSGDAWILMSWYGGTQPYTAIIYNGTSSSCSGDTNVFNSENNIQVPPVPFGYNPNQKYTSFVGLGPTDDPNTTEFSGYYCGYVLDSQGNSIETPAIYFNLSNYITTTTTSISSTSTTSSTVSSISSTISYPAYNSTLLTTSSSTSSTTIFPSLGIPTMIVSIYRSYPNVQLTVRSTWNGGTPPYYAHVIQSSLPNICVLSQYVYNSLIYGNQSESISYAFTPPSTGTSYYCVYVSDSAGNSASSQIFTFTPNASQLSTTPTTTISGISCGCICSGRCIRPANITVTSSIPTTISTTSILPTISYSTSIYTTIPAPSVQVVTAISRSSSSIPSLTEILSSLLRELSSLFR